MTYNVFGGTLNLTLSIYLCTLYSWLCHLWPVVIWFDSLRCIVGSMDMSTWSCLEKSGEFHGDQRMATLFIVQSVRCHTVDRFHVMRYYLLCSVSNNIPAVECAVLYLYSGWDQRNNSPLMLAADLCASLQDDCTGMVAASCFPIRLDLGWPPSWKPRLFESCRGR